MTELAFRQRIVPAILSEGNEIYVGPRGAQHIDIRFNFADDEGPLKGEAGFYDPLRNKFYPKYGMDGLNIDSQRLEPALAMLPKTREDIEKPNWANTSFMKIPVDVYYDFLKKDQLNGA